MMAEVLERSDSNLKPSEIKAAYERSRHIDALLDEERENRQNEIQLLTLGSGGSGKSTFIKQLKILYDADYSHEERMAFKPLIYKAFRRTVKKLVAAQKELGLAFENDKLKEFAEKVANNESNGVCNNNEVLPADCMLLEMFWEDGTVRKCYNQRHAHHIDDSSKHFLENISRISSPDYVPTTEDILLLRSKTNAIYERQVTVSGYTYRVIDVGGQRNHRKKWIHLFEGVTSVVFFASLSCYNETLEEDNSVNTLQDSLDLFQVITHDHYLEETEFILFLNKYDLFVEKLQTCDLQSYFSDYEGGSDPDKALEYIRDQFMARKPESKNVYVHITTATDTDLMKTVLNDVFDILVDANLKKVASF